MKILTTALASTVFGIALILLSPYYAINPGVISRGHEKIKQDCFLCHTLAAGVEKYKCTNCHAIKNIGYKVVDDSTRINLRANLIHSVVSKMECAHCHQEHKGTPLETAKMIFTHDVLPAYIKDDCNQCHTQSIPKDEIHIDKSLRCGTCHSIEAWKPATFINHEKYFRFDNDHPAKCATCHPQQTFKQYTCYSCHEHSEAKILSEHQEEGIKDITNCVKCHRSANKDEAEKANSGEGSGHQKESDGEDH